MVSPTQSAVKVPPAGPAGLPPDRHHWFKNQIRPVAESFRQRLADLATAGYPLGEYEIPEAGTVVVRPADEGFGGSLGLDLAGEKSPERQAERVVVPLFSAAQKPRRKGLANVAFIDLPRLSEKLVVQAVEDALMRRPDAYRNLDGVIYRTIREVHNVDRLPFQEWRGWARTMPWGTIDGAALNRLAQGLIASPHRLTMPKTMVRKSALRGPR